MSDDEALATLAYDLGVDPSYEPLQLLERTYVEAYANLAATVRRRNALTTAERELIMLALNASIHLYDRRGVELHTRRAMAAGATPQQILGTRAEAIGSHTMSTCVPVLLEELERAGQPVVVPADDDLTDDDRAVKERVTELRGMWYEGWRPMLRLDPEFLVANHTFLSIGSALEPRLLELVSLAFNVSTTHLYLSGARLHIRNALANGVTADEILEVFELTVLIAYQSLVLLLPAVHDALMGVDLTLTDRPIIIS